MAHYNFLLSIPNLSKGALHRVNLFSFTVIPPAIGLKKVMIPDYGT